MSTLTRSVRRVAMVVAVAVAGAMLTTATPAGSVAGFGDVPSGQYYTRAIQWMVDEEITAGMTPSCFAPGHTVDRGQAAAFLWRMQGEPAASRAHGFVDVVQAWQHDAVSWMVEEEVTYGTSAWRYSPDAGLTRGQIAAFLHRLAGSPSAPRHRFVDVVQGWQHDAVSWMVHEGITFGTTATTFSPERALTRADLAAFLYRYNGEPAVTVDDASPRCGSTAAAGTGGVGAVGVVAIADSAFDRYTSSPSAAEWQWMRDHYSRLVVWSPYWDDRLGHFGDVLAYIDAYAIYADENVANQHPDWVMRQADGSPAYIDFACGQSGGCPQYAGDLTHPGFVAHQLGRIQRLVEAGYPGIMLDDVNMLHRWADRWGNEVTPIDARTGRPMTLTAWRDAMADFVELVRTRFPGLEIMHNSIWYSDSPGFGDPHVRRQIRAADYLMLERGATDRGLVDGTGTYGFQTFLAFIDRVHAEGTRVLLLDETGGPDEQLFNLAATMLVDTGGDLVGSENRHVTAPGSFWSGFETDLGPALGRRYLDQGFIVRDFANGRVVLREPDLGAATYGLGATMVDSSGAAVGSVRLSGGEAEILRRP